MANIDIQISNFNAGELNPLLYGRTDTEFYNRSCRTLDNMFVHVEGPAQKRGGTKYIIPAHVEDQPVRLIEFEFSREDAFTLEFGHLYIRVLAEVNGVAGVVQDHNDVDVIITTTYTGDQLEDIQFVQSADIIFLAHPDHPPMQFVRGLDSSGNITWTIEAYENDDGPYLDENLDEDRKLRAGATTGSNITLTASGTGFEPFVAEDVGRFVRIFGGNSWGYAKIITFTSSTVVRIDIVDDFENTTATDRWQLSSWSSVLGYPAAVTIYERRLVWAATRANPQTFWASTTDGFYTFTPTDVDGTLADDNGLSLTLGGSRVSLIRWLVGAQNLIIGTSGGIYRTNTTSGAPLTARTARVLYDNGVECADVQPIQIGSNVFFLQKQRKKFFSVRYDFGIDALSDSNVSQFSEHLLRARVKDFVIQKEPNTIVWAVLDDGRMVGCTYVPKQEVIAWHSHTIAGSFLGENAVAESLTSIAGDGEDNVWMVVKRTINGATRRYIERFVEHDDDIPQPDSWFLDAAQREETVRSITAITRTGDAVTITTSENHGFVAGDRLCFYNIVGASELNLTRADIVSVTDDTITINFTGDLGTYIRDGEVRRFFQTVTGLDYLEGETVSVLADGASQPDQTVTSGSITLAEPAAILILGLRFTARLVPRGYIAAGAPVGAGAQNRKVRAVKTTVRLHRSLGLLYGSREEDLTRLPFRRVSDKTDTSVPLFSGDEELNVKGDYSFDKNLFLVNDQPFPFIVLAVYSQLDVTR